MCQIEIENMEFFAYHGCFKEEKIVGNRFLVDLRMEADCQKPSQTDELADALDYQRAYELVKREMALPSNLLERVCERILAALFDDLPGLRWAQVKVSKMNPPMGGRMERVSVRLDRRREN